MSLSQDKREAIISRRLRYFRDVEQKELDEVYDIAMRMGLKEETVRKVWDEVTPP